MASVIVASRKDEVSMKIAEILRECYDFKEVNESLYRAHGIELRMIEEKHIYADGLGENWNADLLIVASSHRSEAGVKALLTHPVGNWGLKAELGGAPKTISATSAKALYTSINFLREEADRLRLTDWRIGLEVTHHGPRTNVPLIFVEAGGPPDQIPERRALEAVASTCFRVAERRLNPDLVAVGFGGGHYAPTFTKLSLEKRIGFGHMCPKYVMPIDEEMIRQAFEKTIEKPRLAILDWKGLKSDHRKMLLETFDLLGVEWMKAR